MAKNEKPILPGGKVSKDTVVVSSWNRQADKTRVNRQKQPQEQITKPQLLFREKPDNTSVPFVPRLFEKVSEKLSKFEAFRPRILSLILKPPFSLMLFIRCQLNWLKLTKRGTKLASLYLLF